MAYVYELLLLGVTFWMAIENAHLIGTDKKIKHGLWALIFAGFVAPTVWLLWPYLDKQQIAAYLFAVFAGHLVAFNISLNLLRRLPWNYTSSATGSILDHVELFLFGEKVWILELLLTAAVITLNIFSL